MNWEHTGKHCPTVEKPIVEVIAESRIGWFKFAVFVLVTFLLALAIAFHGYVTMLYLQHGLSSANQIECKALAWDQLVTTVKTIKQATQ